MNCQDRVFPSSERRGSCAIKKMLRSLLIKAQTGWSVPDNVTTSTFTIMTHPVCAASEASRLFLTGAATPPVPGGEHPVLPIHSHLPRLRLQRRLSFSYWRSHPSCSRRGIHSPHDFR